jgi:hypothetical protein
MARSIATVMNSSDHLKLPAGTSVLDREPATGNDVQLALELAALGASSVLVRAVGGQAALSQLEHPSSASNNEPSPPQAQPA